MKYLNRYYVHLRIIEDVDLAGQPVCSIDAAYCNDFTDPARPANLIDLAHDLPVQLRYDINLPKIRDYLAGRLRSEIMERIASGLAVPASSTSHPEQNDDVSLLITVSYDAKDRFFTKAFPIAGAILNLLITIITTLVIALSLRLTFQNKFGEENSTGVTAAIYVGSITQFLFSMILYHLSDASTILASMGRSVDERIAGIKQVKNAEFTLMPWYFKLISALIEYQLYFLAAGFVGVNSMFFNEQITSVVTEAVEKNIIDLPLKYLGGISITAAVMSVLPAAAFVLSFSQKLAHNIQHRLAVLRGNRPHVPDEETRLIPSPLPHPVTSPSAHSTHSSASSHSMHSAASSTHSTTSSASYHTARSVGTPASATIATSPWPTLPLSPAQNAATHGSAGSPRGTAPAPTSTRRRTASTDLLLPPTPSQQNLRAFRIRGAGFPS